MKQTYAKGAAPKRLQYGLSEIERAGHVRYYVTTIRSATSPDRWFEWVIPAPNLKSAREAASRAYAGPEWFASEDTRWYPDESSWPNTSPL